MPVRAGDAGQPEVPEPAGRGHVRAAAQVDELGGVAVRRHGRRADGGLGGEIRVRRPVGRGDSRDDLPLEWLVGEEGEALIDRELLSDEGLVGGDDRAHLLLDRRQVLVREALGFGELEVVVEAVLDRRPDREARPRVDGEDRLGHHVRCRMANHRAALVDSPGDDPHEVALGERGAEIDEDPVHLGGDGVGRESLADRSGEVGRRRAAGNLARRAVRYGDGDVRRRISHTLTPGSAECNASLALHVRDSLMGRRRPSFDSWFDAEQRAGM